MHPGQTMKSQLRLQPPNHSQGGSSPSMRAATKSRYLQVPHSAAKKFWRKRRCVSIFCWNWLGFCNLFPNSIYLLRSPFLVYADKEQAKPGVFERLSMSSNSDGSRTGESEVRLIKIDKQHASTSSSIFSRLGGRDEFVTKTITKKITPVSGILKNSPTKKVRANLSATNLFRFETSCTLASLTKFPVCHSRLRFYPFFFYFHNR